MEIIRCSMQELDEATAFYTEVTAYLTAHINYPKWTHGVYPARESICAAIANGGQYLCRDGGAVVGGFILNNDPDGAYERGSWSMELAEGDYMVVHSLAVAPSAYGRGIAQYMVEFCLQTAKDEGYPAVRLDVVPQNLPAKRLYEKMGFTFAGEFDLLRNIPEIPTFLLYERVL